MTGTQVLVGHVFGKKSFILLFFFISKKHPSRNIVLPAKQVKYISSCVAFKQFMIKLRTMYFEYILFTGYINIR